MTHEHLDSTTTFTVVIGGETRPYKFARADFTEFGLAANDPLNTVGVFCPDDQNAPIMIADQAPPVYAQWATVHEQMCQRENDGHTSCDVVEVTVLDLMHQNGVDRSDIIRFIQERIRMFDRLIKMYNGNSDKQKEQREAFALSKKSLVDALLEVKK